MSRLPFIAGMILSVFAFIHAEIGIVRDGTPGATVVLPSSPAENVVLAADELVAHIELMSGAKLPVVQAGGPVTGTPWDFDATDAIRFDEPNVIVVKISNHGSNDLGTGGLTGPAMIWAEGPGMRASRTTTEPVTLMLADQGVARLPIVVSTGATERVRAAAAELAGMLKRITGATFEAIDHDESVKPDGEKRTVTLTSPYAGLHTLEVSDGFDRTAVNLPGEPPLAVESSLDEHAQMESRWTLYCYVPRGTTSVGGYATSPTGRLRDGSGKVVFDFEQMKSSGYFNVLVPEGMDGAFWRFEKCASDRMLMTIPPYLAAHPSQNESSRQEFFT